MGMSLGLENRTRDAWRAECANLPQHACSCVGVCLDTEACVQMIPTSVRARIAEHRCRSLVQRNMHLFKGCSDKFTGLLMMALTEVQLMPNEVVVKHGDMARHLSFVSEGTVEVLDSKGGLVELITGGGTAACAVGALSFLLGALHLPLHSRCTCPPAASECCVSHCKHSQGLKYWLTFIAQARGTFAEFHRKLAAVPEPYSLIAQDQGTGVLFSVCKTDYEEIIDGHPEQSETISTNLLATYGFARDGTNTSGASNEVNAADTAVHDAIQVRC